MHFQPSFCSAGLSSIYARLPDVRFWLFIRFLGIELSLSLVKFNGNGVIVHFFAVVYKRSQNNNVK